MILVIDTAQPEASIGLWQDDWKVKETWEAGRNLSSDILVKIDQVYKKAGLKLSETTGIIVNQGPGSYTGLRIGLSIANTMAYTLGIPIVGVEQPAVFDDLAIKGLAKIKNIDKFNGSALPEYGSEPNITQPKKIF